MRSQSLQLPLCHTHHLPALTQAHCLSLYLSLTHTLTHYLYISLTLTHYLFLTHLLSLTHTNNQTLPISFSLIFPHTVCISFFLSHTNTTYLYLSQTHTQTMPISFSLIHCLTQRLFLSLSHSLFCNFRFITTSSFLCLVVLQLQSSHFILYKSFSFEAYHRDSATEKEMEVNRCLYEIDRYRNENNLARRLSRIEQYLTD